MVGGVGVFKVFLQLIYIKVEELFIFMIIVFDNIVINEFIFLVGFEKINECVKNLGLKKIVLNCYMMDEIVVEKGIDNYMCVFDVVKCLREIYEGSFLWKFSCEKIMRMLEMQQFQYKFLVCIGLVF